MYFTLATMAAGYEGLTPRLSKHYIAVTGSVAAFLKNFKNAPTRAFPAGVRFSSAALCCLVAAGFRIRCFLQVDMNEFFFMLLRTCDLDLDLHARVGFSLSVNQKLLKLLWEADTRFANDCPEVPKVRELQALAQIIKDVAPAVAAIPKNPLTREYVLRATEHTTGTVRELCVLLHAEEPSRGACLLRLACRTRPLLRT